METGCFVQIIPCATEKRDGAYYAALFERNGCIAAQSEKESAEAIVLREFLCYNQVEPKIMPQIGGGRERLQWN